VLITADINIKYNSLDTIEHIVSIWTHNSVELYLRLISTATQSLIMNFNSGIEHLIGGPVLSKWKDNKRWYYGTLIEVVDGFGLVRFEERGLRECYIPTHMIKASDRLPPMQERPDTGLVPAEFNIELFKEYARSIAGRDKILCLLDRSKMAALNRVCGSSVFANCGGSRLLAHHRVDSSYDNQLRNPELKSKRTSNDRFQRNQMETAQDCVYYEDRGQVVVITTSATIIFHSNWTSFKTCYANHVSYVAWKNRRAASPRAFNVMY
jgi:hypothetical protein